MAAAPPRGFAAVWGASEAECDAAYPCDLLLPDHDLALFRAVDVEAAASLSFRWLCQLRIAPYSYDLIDNFGQRSPQTLTPGLERLQAGQRFMTIFRLAEFEPGRSLTLTSRGRIFGRVAVTYLVEDRGEGRSRIVAKVLAAPGRGLLGGLLRSLLAPGDLIMMRRQLLNLKGLAEETAAAERV